MKRVGAVALMGTVCAWQGCVDNAWKQAAAELSDDPPSSWMRFDKNTLKIQHISLLDVNILFSEDPIRQWKALGGPHMADAYMDKRKHGYLKPLLVLAGELASMTTAAVSEITYDMKEVCKHATSDIASLVNTNSYSMWEKRVKRSIVESDSPYHRVIRMGPYANLNRVCPDLIRKNPEIAFNVLMQQGIREKVTAMSEDEWNATAKIWTDALKVIVIPQRDNRATLQTVSQYSRSASVIARPVSHVGHSIAAPQSAMQQAVQPAANPPKFAGLGGPSAAAAATAPSTASTSSAVAPGTTRLGLGGTLPRMPAPGANLPMAVVEPNNAATTASAPSAAAGSLAASMAARLKAQAPVAPSAPEAR